MSWISTLEDVRLYIFTDHGAGRGEQGWDSTVEFKTRGVAGVKSIMHAAFPNAAQSAAIAEFCKRHNVARLSLFGSMLHGDARPDSDIDLLVEFPPGQTPSLLVLGGMLMELREMLGRDVDLKTPFDLSRYFRERVVHESRTLYAA